MRDSTSNLLRKYAWEADDGDLLLIAKEDLQELLDQHDLFQLVAADWARMKSASNCPSCHLAFSSEPCDIAHGLVRRLLKKLR